MRALVIAIAFGVILQQPTFRSRVDLLRLDVTVLDRDGRPVRDLRPEDFVVTLDGTPRPVAFARFYGPDDTTRAVVDAPVSVRRISGRPRAASSSSWRTSRASRLEPKSRSSRQRRD